jgi:hypothetical protein
LFSKYPTYPFPFDSVFPFIQRRNQGMVCSATSSGSRCLTRDAPRYLLVTLHPPSPSVSVQTSISLASFSSTQSRLQTIHDDSGLATYGESNTCLSCFRSKLTPISIQLSIVSTILTTGPPLSKLTPTFNLTPAKLLLRGACRVLHQ